MAGTYIGGKKAAAINQANDPDFYKRIGAKGGSARVTKGFGANPEIARVAGQKGGAISRRPKMATCVACLSPRVPTKAGLCGKCEPQDSPELRALLNINEKGEPCTTTNQTALRPSTSTSSTSTTSHHSKKSPVALKTDGGHPVSTETSKYRGKGLLERYRARRNAKFVAKFERETSA